MFIFLISHRIGSHRRLTPQWKLSYQMSCSPKVSVRWCPLIQKRERIGLDRLNPQLQQIFCQTRESCQDPGSISCPEWFEAPRQCPETHTQTSPSATKSGEMCVAPIQIPRQRSLRGQRRVRGQENCIVFFCCSFIIFVLNELTPAPLQSWFPLINGDQWWNTYVYVYEHQ